MPTAVTESSPRPLLNNSMIHPINVGLKEEPWKPFHYTGCFHALTIKKAFAYHPMLIQPLFICKASTCTALVPLVPFCLVESFDIKVFLISSELFIISLSNDGAPCGSHLAWWSTGSGLRPLPTSQQVSN